MRLSQSETSVLKLKRNAGGFVFRLFRFCFIFGFSYLFLFPVFYMLSTALQNPNDSLNPFAVWLPTSVSFKSFGQAFKYLDFKNSAWLTFIITVFGTIGTLFSCSLVGYAFARYKFPLKNILFVFVILMIMVPPQTLIMSNYLLYRFFDFGGILKIFGKSVNLLGTPWVFILPSFMASGLRAGLYIFIFRQFFSGLSKELEEAASIDGCDAVKTFYKIMMPLAVPAFVTVLLFSVIWYWNDYYNSAIYFVGDKKTLMVMLKNLANALEIGGVIGGSTPLTSRMYLQAGAFICILPLLIMYLFLQKFFTESIERTGIVG